MGFLDFRVKVLLPLHQSAGIDVTHQEKMWNASPALGGSFGHEPRNLAQRFVSGRRWRVLRRGECLDIFGADRPVGTCPTDLAYFYAEFARNTPSFRRDLWSRFDLLSRRSGHGRSLVPRAARSASSRRHGSGVQGRSFARSDQPSNGFSHGYNGPDIRRDSGKHPIAGRFYFDDRFIGLDLKERLAFADALAFFFPPSQNFPGFLRHFQRGHYDTDRHSRFSVAEDILVRSCHSFGFCTGLYHLDHPATRRRLVLARGSKRSVHGEVVRAGHHELFRRKARNDFVSSFRDHDLFFNPRRTPAVRRGPKRFEREHHPRLDFMRMLKRDQTANHRLLPNRETNSVSELQRECRFLVRETEFLSCRPDCGNFRGRAAWLNKRDSRVKILATPLVCIYHRVRGVPDRKAPVVTGPVAHVGMQDVVVNWIARAKHAIGKNVRVRAAALTRNRIHSFNIFGAEVVEHFAHKPDSLVFAHARLHRPIQLVVRCIHHHRRMIEQGNLILRLDDTRVRHELLAVHNGDPFALQCEQDRRLDNVNPQRLLMKSTLLELHFYFARNVFRASHLWRHRAAQQRDSRARTLAQPRAILLMVPGSRPEVPKNGLIILGQQRESTDLVLCPGTDMRGCEIAHIVHVETQQRTHFRFGEESLGSSQSLRAKALKIDAVFPIHRHSSIGLQCHDTPPVPQLSSFATKLPCGLKYRLLGGYSRIFQGGREGNRYMHRAHALDRGFQVIESALRDDCSDLPGDSVPAVALINDDHSGSLLGRFDHRLFIERPRRPRIYHLRADPNSFEQLRRSQRDLHHAARGYYGDVASRVLHVRHAEWNGVILIRYRALELVHHLVFEKDDRIFITNGGLQEALCVVGGRWHGHF